MTRTAKNLTFFETIPLQTGKLLFFLLRAYSLRKQNWQFWWHVPLAKDYDLLNGGS